MKFCAHEGCVASFKDHYWGSIRAEGWFMQRDGRAWCPEHIPVWVDSWRRKRDAAKS